MTAFSGRVCAYTSSMVLPIDAATRRNLELVRSLSGGRDGALLAAIDRTQTGAGARLLEVALLQYALNSGTEVALHDAEPAPRQLHKNTQTSNTDTKTNEIVDSSFHLSISLIW